MSAPVPSPAAEARLHGRRSHLRAGAWLVALLLLPAATRAQEVPTIGKPPGRPRIRIARLTLPASLPGASYYLEHLRSTLLQESRRADWGAGRGSTISFRFDVEELSLRTHGGVLHVHCSARGELPRGRSARSRLEFGGDPGKPRELVRRVLTIVARGVVTRLSDLERARRTS